MLAVMGGALWVWLGVPVYPDVQTADSDCRAEVSRDTDKHGFKVMSFNVQFMAGKDYVFFFDMDGGPDVRPSEQSIDLTLDRVAALIRDENPDAVLLQEVNDGNDVRTHYRDQIKALQQRLGDAAFPCVASAYYWQADYIPHPKINGPVGMQLVTLSRHPIVSADRYQLPRMPMDPVSQHFYFQRALLEARIEYQGKTVALLNTHFDAWADGTGVLRQQLAVVQARVKELEQHNIPWVAGGDFNMLPPDGGLQLASIEQAGTGSFEQPTAIKPLYDRYGAIPSLEDLRSARVANWYTHFPNDTRVTGPDRTIDYLFYSSDWQLLHSHVRQRDTLEVSDHLPVVGVFSMGAVEP
ncbi:MAG: endonuclease/exonuclease/phosphatase family protein [Candidatus Pelagadaptatus aseana]